MADNKPLAPALGSFAVHYTPVVSPNTPASNVEQIINTTEVDHSVPPPQSSLLTKRKPQLASPAPSPDQTLTEKAKTYAHIAKTHLLHSPLPERIPTFGVDLVIVYDPTSSSAKAQLPPNIKKLWKENPAAEESAREWQFIELVRTLRRVGLKVTTRRAREELEVDESKKAKKGGKVWVFIRAEDELLEKLKEKERDEDFMHGVTTAPLSSTTTITPAERIRLVYEYLVSPSDQGGLSITPSVFPWNNVTAIFALHDKKVNDKWTHSWMSRNWKVGLQIEEHDMDLILNNFGPSLALYFHFLSYYTIFTAPLSVIGLFFFLLPGVHYSPIYGFIASIWSLAFVESWRIKERSLSHKMGTWGIENRPTYRATASTEARERVWWRRDLKMLSSLPALLMCGAFLVGVITVIFVFEAFVSHLYTGFGKEYTSLIPTIAFAVIVPQILTLYRKIAEALTKWEDHASEAEYQNALTSKVFALNSIVAFANLFLSAYVYIPFGEHVMSRVDHVLFSTATDKTVLEKVIDEVGGPSAAQVSQTQVAKSSHPKGRGVIDRGRLRGQMFAYTVTTPIINFATELILPIVLRKYNEYKAGETPIEKKVTATGETVVTHNEKFDHAGDEELFMAKVEREAALPDYNIFGDYAEMVTQLGYVYLWSICWPLASVPTFINNYVELRSDALKVCLNVRRPISTRVASIGPWLNALTVLSWLSFLTNTTLYLLFHPSSTYLSHLLLSLHPDTPSLVQSATASPSISSILFPTLLAALIASHVFFALQSITRYVMGKLLWDPTLEAKDGEKRREKMRREFLERHKHEGRAGVLERRRTMEGAGGAVGAVLRGAEDAFWGNEGVGEKDVLGHEAVRKNQ